MSRRHVGIALLCALLLTGPALGFTTCTTTELEPAASRLPMEGEDPVVIGSHVYLVYVTGRSIMFQSSADGGRHFTAQRLDDGTARLVNRPRLAAVGNRVYVVWQSNMIGSGQVLFRASDDNGATFSPQVSLGPSFVDDASQMGVSGLGITVAFVNADRKLALVSSDDGGATWPHQQVASLGGHAREESAGRRGGNIVASWSELSDTGNYTYVATSTDAGATYTVKKLTPVPVGARERQVAVSETTGTWYIYAIDQSPTRDGARNGPGTDHVLGTEPPVVAPDDDDEPDYLDEIDPKTGIKRNSSGILFTSTDKGLSWTSQSLSVDSTNQWIAVTGKTIYLSWLQRFADGLHVEMTRSADDGRTWSAHRDLSGQIAAPSPLPDEALRPIMSIHAGIFSEAYVSGGSVIVRSTDPVTQRLSKPIRVGRGSHPMIDGGNVLWLGPGIGENQAVFYASCR
jgi:hypothetical protein